MAGSRTVDLLSPDVHRQAEEAEGHLADGEARRSRVFPTAFAAGGNATMMVSELEVRPR